MEQIFSGKTVEDAIENGLKALNITLADAKVKVLDEGKKGILGIGSRPAKVEITLAEKEQEINEAEKETTCECSSEIEEGSDADRAVKFLKKLFSYLGVEANLTAKEEENLITISLSSETSSGLIGYRGEVLDSFQTLAGAIANKGRDNYRRVIVDCEGYREKREETLKNLALKLADKAIAKGRKIRLEPMNPFERRIIHSALSTRDDIKTQSEGKDPSRYIVIIPNNLKFGDRYQKRDRGYSRGGSRNSAPRAKKSSGFGATFLGNSLKNNDQ
ncbi:MAG: protein jag [Clostridia bacterium]|nr:protein jag [Clostridia bacterium]